MQQIYCFCLNEKFILDYYSKERKLALLRIFRLMCKEGRLKTERLSTVHLNSLRKSATSMLSMGSISIINPESREKLIICRRRCAYNFPVSLVHSIFLCIKNILFQVKNRKNLLFSLDSGVLC